jgi:hypothetical protein
MVSWAQRATVRRGDTEQDGAFGREQQIFGRH